MIATGWVAVLQIWFLVASDACLPTYTTLTQGKQLVATNGTQPLTPSTVPVVVVVAVATSHTLLGMHACCIAHGQIAHKVHQSSKELPLPQSIILTSYHEQQFQQWQMLQRGK